MAEDVKNQPSDGANPDTNQDDVKDKGSKTFTQEELGKKLSEERKKELSDFWRGFVKPLAFLIPPFAILYFIQNHLSVCLVIGAITSVMMLIAGTRLIYFVLTGGAGIAAVAIYLFHGQLGDTSDNFRLDRIKTFFDPWSDAAGTGYQMIQSLYAIGSGGLFGVGLGQSKQKYLYIPEPQNDFIFAILAEELGFIGCAIVILLFAVFVWRGILISMKSDDMYGSLLAIGVTTLVAVQVIINIAVVTASIPTTGMPLPFFSYGGTALVLLLASCGVLLNISRSTEKV